MAGSVTPVRDRVAVVLSRVLADLIAVASGYAAAFVLRFGYGVASDGSLGPAEPLPLYWKALFLSVPLWIPILALNGLYGARPLAPVSDEIRKVFHAVNLSIMGIVGLSFFLKVDLSRGWLVLAWFCCLGLLVSLRILVRKTFHLLRARGRLASRVLVVGGNEEGRAIVRALQRYPWYGLRPVGFLLGGGEKVDEIGPVNGLPMLGRAKEAASAVARSGAEVVIVAGTAMTDEKLAQLYRELQALPVVVEIKLSTSALNVAASRVQVEPLDGLTLLTMRRAQLPGPQAAVKRVFDVVGSLGTLMVTAPLLLACAIAVRLGGPGGILYRQVRIGRLGKPFVMFKFRTMYPDADKMIEELSDRNQAEGVLFKIRDDPRITRVGTFLRRWALDELPQVFNVLKGDMSLVGPRPPLPAEVARYDKWLQARLKVRPGITGLWQANGRHELDFADYVRYDLFYVENWSLAMDLHIMWKTIPAIVSRRGSY